MIMAYALGTLPKQTIFPTYSGAVKHSTKNFPRSHLEIARAGLLSNATVYSPLGASEINIIIDIYNVIILSNFHDFIEKLHILWLDITNKQDIWFLCITNNMDQYRN